MLLAGLTCGLATASCVELQLLLGGARNPPPAGNSTGNDNDGEPGNDNDSPVPAVRLSVSNPSPIVGEEVVLTCSLTSGDAAGASFSFEPFHPRLIVDAARGTARFIVSESDAGTEFSFRCRAVVDGLSSDLSNEVSFIPVGEAPAAEPSVPRSTAPTSGS